MLRGRAEDSLAGVRHQQSGSCLCFCVWWRRFNGGDRAREGLWPGTEQCLSPQEPMGEIIGRWNLNRKKKGKMLSPNKTNAHLCLF